MKQVERPYRLECWEMDPDLAEETWRLWSTYVTEENAMERRDKLISKGHKARVMHTPSEQEMGNRYTATCSFCGEEHADGSCLL